ncbi:MAG: preprotein translocase subunit SecG [Magnetococcales bacterium]|nr:preprotein translocase subunit SecG [Magnetococcales bacterium]
MTLIVTVLHILVCMALVFVVLLQKGSGADMGAAFGGSSQSLFGARGSGDFLSKLTAGLATVFMITSLTLAFYSTRPSGDRSVMDGAPATSAPAKPAATDAVPAKAKEVEKKEPEAESGPPVPAKSAPKKPEGAAREATGGKPVPPPPSAIEEAPAKPPQPAKPVEAKRPEPPKPAEPAKKEP